MKLFSLLYYIIMCALVAACANPGQGPDGGPYDETPPTVTLLSPQMGERDVKKVKKVTLGFSEAIKVENPSEKIVVSPPQHEQPEIKISGKRITVELVDSLLPNTTYTIDFSDAIKDATEGNPLGNFTYYFSTGELVDTMEVAGNVLNAADLNPVKGILVGLHHDLSDSAFSKLPFDRVARTDERGHFSIKGVAPGTYRIYALSDRDGDFKYSRGEEIAFSAQEIKPSSFADTRNDTLWADTVRYDSIRTISYTHYLPDDVVLLAFRGADQPRALLKTVRAQPESFTVYFTAPSKEIPTVRGLNFDAKDAFIEQRSAGNDTITYWISRRDVAAIDSLRMLYSYMATNDSTGVNELRSDTLEIVPRLTNARLAQQQAAEKARWEKELERRHKKGDYSREQPPVAHLNFNEKFESPLPPNKNIDFLPAEPLVQVDTTKFHLFLREDSNLHAVPFILEHRQLLRYTLLGSWRPGQQYRIVVDSAAVVGLSGLVNKPLERDFSIAKADEMGSLFVTLTNADSTTIVQLLQSEKEIVRQVHVDAGRADFYYLKPGKYFLRCFFDANGNNQWDTGDYEQRRQPEAVYYYPQAIEVRANWDTDQAWDLKQWALTAQKPTGLRQATNKNEQPSAHMKNLKRKGDKTPKQ